MKRPTRLEILEYALEGATTQRGLWSGELSAKEEAELDNHIEWLEKEIQRAKYVFPDGVKGA